MRVSCYLLLSAGQRLHFPWVYAGWCRRQTPFPMTLCWIVQKKDYISHEFMLSAEQIFHVPVCIHCSVLRKDSISHESVLLSAGERLSFPWVCCSVQEKGPIINCQSEHTSGTLKRFVNSEYGVCLCHSERHSFLAVRPKPGHQLRGQSHWGKMVADRVLRK